MYYLPNRRKEEECTYIDSNLMIAEKKGVIIFHLKLHYDAIINPN